MGRRRPQGKAVREAQLEILEPGAADGDAEADDGGLADAGEIGRLRQASP